MKEFKPTVSLVKEFNRRAFISFGYKSYNTYSLYLPTSLPLRGEKINVSIDKTNRIVCVEKHENGRLLNAKGQMSVSVDFLGDLLREGIRKVYLTLEDDNKWYGSY